MTIQHPDYGLLAARIAVSNLQKNTLKCFSDTMKLLYEYVDEKTGIKAALLSDEVFAVIEKNKDVLNSSIIYDRDYNYDYFGFKTLERGYLMKINGKIVERPQHMLMRVSVGLHKDDIDAVIKTYISCLKVGLLTPHPPCSIRAHLVPNFPLVFLLR